jgi:hypothetical protein
MTKKYKRTNNDLQNIIQKTKHWSKRASLNTGGELVCSWRVSSSTCITRRITLVTNPVISYEWGKDRSVIMTNGTIIVICDTDTPQQ